MRWIAASKSLSKALPFTTVSTLPVPSNLNWFTPYFFTISMQISWKRA